MAPNDNGERTSNQAQQRPRRVSGKAPTKYIREVSKRPTRAILPLVLLCTQASCAVQLAPAYDKQIVDTLVSASELAQTEFATVRGGADKSTFPQHAADYSKIIGKLSTAETLAKIRPAPKGAGIIPLGSIAPTTADQIPSVIAIRKMEDDISTMKSTYEAKGLNATELAAYKGQFEYFMTNALTYEKALQR
jgi:hypothetical protein